MEALQMGGSTLAAVLLSPWTPLPQVGPQPQAAALVLLWETL
jgi:hypothetical protein